MPGEVIGQDQRQRARHEAGDLVGIDVHHVAEALLLVAQEFAPERVDGDVLGCGEEGHGDGQRTDGGQVRLRRQPAEQRDAGQQGQLADEHPAAPAAESQAEPVAVAQRRPGEFPDVGELHQRQQADGLEIDPALAQPGGEQADQHEQRQPRRKAGQDAEQDAPVQQAFTPGRGSHSRWSGGHDRRSGCPCRSRRRADRGRGGG